MPAGRVLVARSHRASRAAVSTAVSCPGAARKGRRVSSLTWMLALGDHGSGGEVGASHAVFADAFKPVYWAFANGWAVRTPALRVPTVA